MKVFAIIAALFALTACAETGASNNTSPSFASQQSLTASQRAQIRAIRNSDDTTLSQRRRIRAVLAR